VAVSLALGSLEVLRGPALHPEPPVAAVVSAGSDAARTAYSSLHQHGEMHPDPSQPAAMPAEPHVRQEQPAPVAPNDASTTLGRLATDAGFGLSAGEGGDAFADSIDRTVAAVEPAHASSKPVTQPPPVHISIPAVGIDTEIVEVAPTLVELDGQPVFRWAVADWAAGHHDTSANPGEGGNIVLSGHADVRGEVFRGLHDIIVGMEITVTSAAGTFTYYVHEVHVRLDAGATLADRLATGMFLAPMPEERLTLVTCWPYRIDTHRVIVVAKPDPPA
jgi:LPXTG-site transpeptidase (sortase) family protein